jgi:hypothetical protein
MPISADGDAKVELTQKRFAKRLVEAMDALGVKGVEVAVWLETDATTVSRYRNPTYEYGPPDAGSRRLLERRMGLPEGYFDGSMKVDLTALRIERHRAKGPRGGKKGKAGDNGSAESLDTAGGQGDAEGWLWGEASEGEEFMRAMLRNLERTTRAMVGKPDLFSAEDLRLNRMGVIRAAMHSHELAGKSVPRWLRELYDQVSDGSFR